MTGAWQIFPNFISNLADNSPENCNVI